ncbi:MAG: hypothetical protein ACLPKT_03945, partial [Methylocella sp.]
QPINHHCVSDLGIKFHCEHPSSPSMPINGIETAYKNRYTFAPKGQFKLGKLRIQNNRASEIWNAVLAA